MPYRDVPKLVIRRLPVYLRVLDSLTHRDVEIISSKELSEETGFTAEQIRKDLAYFGAFGTRGTGYKTHFLRKKILEITGLDKKTSIIVVGAGHLGRALTRYTMTKNPYISIAAIFDNDPEVIGEGLLSLKVKDIKDMPSFISEEGIKVAVLTMPAEHAHEIVDQIIESGIKAILNFVPVKLEVPKNVHIHNADITIELQSLIYYSSTEGEKDF